MYMWPPVDQSGSTGWPHICEYMSSSNWTHGVIKRKEKKRHEVERKSIGCGLDLGRVVINMLKVHCVKSHSTNKSIILKNPVVSLYTPVF